MRSILSSVLQGKLYPLEKIIYLIDVALTRVGDPVSRSLHTERTSKTTS